MIASRALTPTRGDLFAKTDHSSARRARFFLFLRCFVLGFEPLPRSEDLDAVVFLKDQQVLVACDDAIGLASDGGGKAGHIVLISTRIFRQ